MNDNPYAPPAESVERPPSSERMVGDFAHRLDFREFAYLSYLAVVVAGLMLGVHRGGNDDLEGILLWISLITFVFHCILLLQTRGFIRSSVITINAILIFGNWIWGSSPLVVANLILHFVSSIGFWLSSVREARQITSLLNAPDAIRVLEKYVEIKGESASGLKALGDAYRNNKRSLEALTAMQRCMQVAPENFETHLILISLLGETGAFHPTEKSPTVCSFGIA
jgi:hypothetical protein